MREYEIWLPNGSVTVNRRLNLPSSGRPSLKQERVIPDDALL